MPLCIPTYIGFACCLHTPDKDYKSEQSSVWVAIKSMDWGGLTIVTASLAGILFALNSGYAVYPWTSGKILAPLICGCAGLLAFVAYEKFVAKAAAILPGRLFSNPTAMSGYIMTVIHAMIVWTVTYYFFLYVRSPLQSLKVLRRFLKTDHLSSL